MRADNQKIRCLFFSCTRDADKGVGQYDTGVAGYPVDNLHRALQLSQQVRGGVAFHFNDAAWLVVVNDVNNRQGPPNCCASNVARRSARSDLSEKSVASMIFFMSLS